MSSVQAVQQIGTLLSQAGVPSGLSLDIAQRILTATGAGGFGARSRLSRTITGETANNSTFYNGFKAPEQALRPTQDEQLAKDGIDGQRGRRGFAGYNGIAGLDGQDGQDGVVDYDRLQQMIDAAVARAISQINGGGVSIGIVLADLKKLWDAVDDLKRRVGWLESDVRALKDDMAKAKNDIKAIQTTLKRHNRRITAIEDALKQTVNCPEVMP